MRNITTDELALIHGAGLDKDASVAIGTAAGGFLGKVASNAIAGGLTKLCTSMLGHGNL